MEHGAENAHVLTAQAEGHHEPDGAENHEKDGELRGSDVEEVVQAQKHDTRDTDGGRVDDAVHRGLDGRPLSIGGW